MNFDPFDDSPFDTQSLDEYTQSLDEYNKKSGFAYEENIVKQLLTRFDLSGEIPELKSRTNDLTGEFRLSFNIFLEAFPDFPVYLGIRRIPYVQQISFNKLFRSFTSTNIFKAWEDVAEYRPDDLITSKTGVVFNWPAIGTMVLHNFQGNDSSGFFCRKLRDCCFYLERFPEFCDRINNTWNHPKNILD